jgi:glycine cleavage system aminomethyltransferase T
VSCPARELAGSEARSRSRDADAAHVQQIPIERPAETGTEVEVGKLDGLQKRIPSRVVRIPFYDPEKTDPRS